MGGGAPESSVGATRAPLLRKGWGGGVGVGQAGGQGGDGGFWARGEGGGRRARGGDGGGLESSVKHLTMTRGVLVGEAWQGGGRWGGALKNRTSGLIWLVTRGG